MKKLLCSIFISTVISLLVVTSCKTDVDSGKTDEQDFFASLQDSGIQKFTNEELNGTSWTGTLEGKNAKISIENDVFTMQIDKDTYNFNLFDSMVILQDFTNTEPNAENKGLSLDGQILYLEKKDGNMMITLLNGKQFFPGDSSSIYGTWEGESKTKTISKDTLTVNSYEQESIFNYTLLGKGFEQNTARITYTFEHSVFGTTTHISDYKKTPNGLIEIYINPNPNIFTKTE